MATGRIGVTPNLGIRWSKVPTGGTTSLSGNDDNSIPLAYSAGYEAVYRNGVLLSRGNDYTATNGTSITLVDATITGDLIEVFANQTVALTDTYSQSAANAKFINNTLTTTTGDIIYASAANTPARLGIGSTDQVLKVSGGIPAWGAIGFNTGYAYTSTNQSTTSTSYTTLGTATEVTVTTGTKALVSIKCRMGNEAVGNGVWAHVGFAISGATTVSASDEFSISSYKNTSAQWIEETGATFVVTGLTAGSNTFALRFSAQGGFATPAYFANRSISVVNLGS